NLPVYKQFTPAELVGSFSCFSLRPPPGGVDEGAGGCGQGRRAAQLCNDRQQGREGAEKLRPLGAGKGAQ
ncbi:MAG: hypothetical protein ONB47_16075, partial [candidate division KSB1 bacterium]|nr:hypothetical protein [candidate division KSB1 bacterium]